MIGYFFGLSSFFLFLYDIPW